jgi:hypothetical protein
MSTHLMFHPVWVAPVDTLLHVPSALAVSGTFTLRVPPPYMARA